MTKKAAYKKESLENMGGVDRAYQDETDSIKCFAS